MENKWNRWPQPPKIDTDFLGAQKEFTNSDNPSLQNYREIADLLDNYNLGRKVVSIKRYNKTHFVSVAIVPGAPFYYDFIESLTGGAITAGTLFPDFNFANQLLYGNHQIIIIPSALAFIGDFVITAYQVGKNPATTFFPIPLLSNRGLGVATIQGSIDTQPSRDYRNLLTDGIIQATVGAANSVGVQFYHSFDGYIVTIN